MKDDTVQFQAPEKIILFYIATFLALFWDHEVHYKLI